MNSKPADKHRRLLVIDDNHAIHDDFRKILCPRTVEALDATKAALFGQSTNAVEQAQFEVDSAYQGQEGLRLVEAALAAGRPYAMAFVDDHHARLKMMHPSVEALLSLDKRALADITLPRIKFRAEAPKTIPSLCELAHHQGLMFAGIFTVRCMST
jgi:uncharacterized protein YjiS (DUF1127 family)